VDRDCDLKPGAIVAGVANGVVLVGSEGAASRTYEGVPRSCPLLSLARVTFEAVSCPHWLQVACSAVATAPQFGQTR
jgi:hypothetical protein